MEPYFDHKFYQSQYASTLEGKDPLQHFMKIDFRGNFETHTDPNNWFNTTLYLRCFPCKGNPFVDFLKQPVSSFDKTLPVIHVYAQTSQLKRAWLAIEYLLRLNKHSVILHLPVDVNCADMFTHHIRRGLIVKNDNSSNKSFYKSDFFRLNLMANKYKKDVWDIPVGQYQEKSPTVLMHRQYGYSRWFDEKNILEPLCINLVHHTAEPLATYSKPSSYQYLKVREYTKRIEDGLDLIFSIDKRNDKTTIIPGCMGTGIKLEELSKEKEFSISFLLSMGSNGENFERPGFQYSARKAIWDAQTLLGQPTRFYVSQRDISKYPKDFHKYVLPTNSKKWIFNSQFNVSIENTRQHNYMSEKLLGCFASLTIPIYLGCPNVRDYFDERGMFIAESVDDIIKISQSITKETYKKMLPYLIENQKRAFVLTNLFKKTVDEFLEKEFPKS
ncbi:MAG: hypothetical protein C0432_01130 [Candidatus Puniceispirillum sp.]|nr:hypothetical protein [Candidatus Pelagibacter sp.]MBA4282885.1 hypothetical protein [Candidatus Puniceispirillum sp.]